MNAYTPFGGKQMPGHNQGNANDMASETEKMMTKQSYFNLMEEFCAAKFQADNEKYLRLQTNSRSNEWEQKYNEQVKRNQLLSAEVISLTKKTQVVSNQLIERNNIIAQLQNDNAVKVNQIKELEEKSKKNDNVSINPEKYEILLNQVEKLKGEYEEIRDSSRATITQQCNSIRMNVNTVLLAEREKNNQIVKKLQEFYSKRLNIEIDRLREQQKEVENLTLESTTYATDLEMTRQLLHKTQINCKNLESKNNELEKKVSKMSMRKAAK